MMRRGASARRGLAGLAMSLLAAGVVAAESAPPAAQDYLLRCQGCHGPEGHGVAGRVPPLADTFAPLVSIPEGRDYLLRVPGAANSPLPDERLAAVLNWLVARYAPGSAAAPFTAADVADGRRRPLMSVRGSRGEVAERLAARGITLEAKY